MIYCIADTVFDITIEGGMPQAGNHGGCMYNVAINLGRLHANVAAFGFAGNDRIGEMAKDFLCRNHVDDSGFLLLPELKSSLALAFLGEQKIPQWTFYKYRPKNYAFFFFPEAAANDILAFGSSLVLLNDFFDRFLKYLRTAGTGVLKYYDPNLRELDSQKRKRVVHLMETADIIKVSEEDLELLFNDHNQDWDILSLPAEKILILTAGKNPLRARWKGKWWSFPVPDTKVISTAGAGDAFSAGMLSAIQKMACDINQYTEAQFESIVNSGLVAAAQACQSKTCHI